MTTEWRVALTQDITENDSDKEFLVPANTEWEILWIRVQYTSTATAGVRQVEIQIQDSGSTIAQWQAGISQNENLSYNYLFGVGVPDLTTMRDYNDLMTPLIGAAFLTAGQNIRVWDNNTIDPTADDMLVNIEYGYHDI
jgi:hypothetical protein